MWRKQPDPQPAPREEEAPPPSAPRVPPPQDDPARVARPADGSYFGKTIAIKGEITGRENLFLDGEMDGAIRLTDARLTVGPTGRVRADAEAKEIEVHGEVVGALSAQERVRIGRTGRLQGDVVTHRIVVEEGAVIRGSVEIVRPGEKPSVATRVAQKSQPEVSSPKSEPGDHRPLITSH